jgi:predicted ATP-dependent serine protease
MKNKIIKTAFEDLDHGIGGGLKRKNFTLIGGPEGLGKTDIICDITGTVARGGNKVLFVTTRDESNYKNKFSQLSKNFILKSFKNGTDKEIRRYISKLSFNKGFVPDVIILDRLQEVTPQNKEDGDSVWDVGVKVAKELYSIANDYNAVLVSCIHTKSTYPNELDEERVGILRIVDEIQEFLFLYDRTLNMLSGTTDVYGKVSKCQGYIDGESYRFKIEL